MTIMTSILLIHLQIIFSTVTQALIYFENYFAQPFPFSKLDLAYLPETRLIGVTRRDPFLSRKPLGSICHSSRQNDSNDSRWPGNRHYTGVVPLLYRWRANRNSGARGHWDSAVHVRSPCLCSSLKHLA